MCPMVPTLTCGLDRSNFSLAMSFIPSSIASLLTLCLPPFGLAARTRFRASCFQTSVAFALPELRRDRLPVGLPRRRSSAKPGAKSGADDRDRTGDLVLTKDALCQLSYIGLRPSGYGRQVGLRLHDFAAPARQALAPYFAHRFGAPAALPTPTIPRPPYVGLPSEARRHAASEGWSGRRGSNPRPTAWKAVTLPLSYSRLRARCAHRFGGQARQSSRSLRPSLRRARPPQHLQLTCFDIQPTSHFNQLACQPSARRHRA